MKCASCNSEIPSSFKHAISSNQCPACGGQIMDEETMAIIEDIENTICSEATIREETAKKLAMAIVMRYTISLDSDITKPIQQKQSAMKIAPPSAAQTVSKEDIINTSDLEKDEISVKEREKIMEDVIRKKYNMANSTSLINEDNFSEEDNNIQNLDPDPKNDLTSALFGASDSNSYLERERLARLAKQQNAFPRRSKP